MVGGPLEATHSRMVAPVSAPRNANPTPRRGLPVTPHQGLPLVERGAPVPPDYVGNHRLVDGRTPAQFRVEYLLKLHKKTRGLQA